MDVPIVNTNYYGFMSITLKAFKQWHEVQDSLKIYLDDAAVNRDPSLIVPLRIGQLFLADLTSD